MTSKKRCSRREFIKKSVSLAAGASFYSCFGTACRNVQEKSPNLLIVFPDQMRGQALEFMQEDPVFTPRLNLFSDESLVLTDAVSNYPLCSPFRGMFMTGKYPHASGVLGNCNTNAAEYGYELKTEARCWSDILKEKGYSLGYIGKWHLDAPHKPYIDTSNNRNGFAWNEWTPPGRRHGFEFWYAYGTYDQHTRPMYWSTKAGRQDFHYVDQWGPEHEADMAAEFIKNEDGAFRDEDKSFALVVAMNPPHMPYDLVPDKYVDQYKHLSLEDLCGRPNIPPAGTQWGDYYRKNIRNYLAMTTGVDEQFGRILDTLKEKGLEENTIVLFTSDHGNCLGIHNEVSKNNHYEESLRVPFLIRWPGKIPPRQDDLLFSSPDIFPTLLDLAGFRDDIPKDVQGRSHARIFIGRQGDRPGSQLYMHVPYGKPAMGRRGIRTHRYTLMISRMPGKKEQVMLHDNIKDPYQMDNIAAENKELVEDLKKRELIPRLKKNKDPWLAG